MLDDAQIITVHQATSASIRPPESEVREDERFTVTLNPSLSDFVRKQADIIAEREHTPPNISAYIAKLIAKAKSKSK